MMVDSKRKGSDWERSLVKILNAKLKHGSFKRIAGSGSIGTNMNEPFLMGDVRGTVEGLSKPLKIEAKIGYGGSKQFSLKKEWLDKINYEANLTYSIPALVGRFSGSRDGCENFVVLDLDVFCELLNLISEKTKELEEEYERSEHNS